MAERRMFAKTIIDSDAFLDMPLSAQALYFHLSMRADDDGFVNNPKKIQRMVGASDDDCKLLVMKRFILTFESGVIVIKHWKIHNYIRGDRKKDTVYPKEFSMLEEKDNGAYSLKGEETPLLVAENDETPRQKAYKESTLPYSFEYKIKKEFWGAPCPCCGNIMKETIEDGIKTNNRIPTIQHNTPISKGGKHELGNISVICKQCNITLQDTETGELNAQEVVEKWDKISMSGKCQAVGGQLAGSCRHRVGKDSLGKDSLGKGNRGKTASRFIPPTLEEVKSYCLQRGNNIDAEHFLAFYTANGWKQSNGNAIKDWKACVITWEKRDKERQKATPKKQNGGFIEDMQELYEEYKAEEENGYN